MINPAIPLLAAEWKLIEPILVQYSDSQQKIAAYVSIIAARAGEPGYTYGLDIANRKLVPTFTREQLDEQLKQSSVPTQEATPNG